MHMYLFRSGQVQKFSLSSVHSALTPTVHQFSSLDWMTFQMLETGRHGNLTRSRGGRPMNATQLSEYVERTIVRGVDGCQGTVVSAGICFPVFSIIAGVCV